MATAADFVAEQAQLAWFGVASSKTGTLTASDDLIADADLVIDASTLSKPAACASTPDAGSADGCGPVSFREDAWPHGNGTARVAGVDCAVPREQVRRGWGELCGKLTIARGTMFRLRNVGLDNHPELPLSTVEIVPPCSAPCATGEARCDATQVCLALGYDTCAYCEAKPVTTCVCRDACAPSADGTECDFDSSPDTPVRGTCRAGSCAASR